MDYSFDDNTQDFSNYGIGEEEPAKPKTDYAGLFKKYSKYLFALVFVIILGLIIYYLFFANRSEVSIFVNSSGKVQYSNLTIYQDNEIYDTVSAGESIKLKYGEYRVEVDGLSGDDYIPITQKTIFVDEYSTEFTINVYPGWIANISKYSLEIPQEVYSGGVLNLKAKVSFSGSEETIILVGSGDLEGQELSMAVKKGENEQTFNIEMPSKSSFSGKLYIKNTSEKDPTYSKGVTIALKTPPKVTISNLKTFGTLAAGKSNEIDLVIKNQSQEEVKDVKVELISVEGIEGTEFALGDVMGWFSFPSLFSIDPQKSASKKIGLTLPIDAPNTKITFHFKVTNLFLNEALTSDVTISQADIGIESAVGLGQIMAGQSKAYAIKVKNNTNAGVTLSLGLESIALLNNTSGDGWVNIADKEKTIAGNDETTFNIEFKPIITAKDDKGSFVLVFKNEFFSKKVTFNFDLKAVDFGFDIILDEKFTLETELVNGFPKYKKITDFVGVKNTGSVDFIIDSIESNTECKTYVKVSLSEDKTVQANSLKEYIFEISVTSISETKSCYLYVNYIDPLTGEKLNKSKPFIIQHN